MTFTPVSLLPSLLIPGIAAAGCSSLLLLMLLHRKPLIQHRHIFARVSSSITKINYSVKPTPNHTALQFLYPSAAAAAAASSLDSISTVVCPHAGDCTAVQPHPSPPPSSSSLLPLPRPSSPTQPSAATSISTHDA